MNLLAALSLSHSISPVKQRKITLHHFIFIESEHIMKISGGAIYVQVDISFILLDNCDKYGKYLPYGNQHHIVNAN